MKQQAATILMCVTLGTTWSVTAAGATGSLAVCDGEAEHLASLEVPIGELSPTVVGHFSADQERDDQPDAMQDHSTAPVLYLTPRVTAILETVFSAVAIETQISDTDEAAESPPIQAPVLDESPVSPVAGDASRKDPETQADSAIENEDTTLSIQRQMYRTDI